MANKERSVEEIRDGKVDIFMDAVLHRDLSSDRPGYAEACLAHVIQKASKNADRLSTRVASLNKILVILGALALLVAAVGVFVAAYDVFWKK